MGSALYRKLSDTESVPKQLWSEWMQLLSTKTNKSASITNVDDEQMSKPLSKELNDILQKEKQCHSDIEHIQKGLIECMDVSSSTNRSLINQTELNNYLNGKGIWTYNDKQNEDKQIEEPCRDNLGAMIEELIGVSEGPDTKYQKIIPDVPISIAFIGKPFVGKTTQSQQIADKYALTVINPETCIKAAMKSFEEQQESDKDAEIELNRQQLIGQQLKNELESGKEVSDELYIDALFDAILTEKDNEQMNGWILDGFPMRRSQAELLEAKLSGYVDPTPVKSGKLSKKKKSKIAPPAQIDEADIPKIKSGLDFVFYMDIDGDGDDKHQSLVERASGRLVDKESGRVYHITENPPPHDSAIKEKLESPPDQDHVASLPQHFKAWDEKKDDLKIWFDKFGTWTQLNCNQDRKVLTKSLIEMVQQRIESKKVEKQEEAQTTADLELKIDVEADKENQDE